MLFDMFKAFYEIESSIADFFFSKKTYIPLCSELPSNISTMTLSFHTILSQTLAEKRGYFDYDTKGD